jgi:hypothetical protein
MNTMRNRLVTLGVAVLLALIAGIAWAQGDSETPEKPGTTEDGGDVEGLPPFLEEGAELPPGLAK